MTEEENYIQPNQKLKKKRKKRNGKKKNTHTISRKKKERDHSYKGRKVTKVSNRGKK